MLEKHRKILALISTNRHFVLNVEYLGKKYVVHPVVTDRKRYELMKKYTIVIVLTSTGIIRLGRMIKDFAVGTVNKLAAIKESGSLPNAHQINALPSQMIAICFELKNK